MKDKEIDRLNAQLERKVRELQSMAKTTSTLSRQKSSESERSLALEKAVTPGGEEGGTLRSQSERREMFGNVPAADPKQAPQTSQTPRRFVDAAVRQIAEQARAHANEARVRTQMSNNE